MTFCFLLVKTATERVVIFQTTCKNVGVHKTQVYAWFPRFSNGHMLDEDQPRRE